MSLRAVNGTYKQWGGRRCGSGKLDGTWRRGLGYGEGVPSLVEERSGRGLAPSPPKKIKNFSLEMACFGTFWPVFLSVSSPEMLNFHLKWWFNRRWTVDDVLLGSTEFYVRVMGLVSLLLHCNASNLVLEILKHGKIWGTICISTFTPNFWELVPVPPVIYAHAHKLPFCFLFYGHYYLKMFNDHFCSTDVRQENRTVLQLG